MGSKPETIRQQLEERLKQGAINYGLDNEGNRKYNDRALETFVESLRLEMGLKSDLEIATWRISTRKSLPPLCSELYIIPVRIISGNPYITVNNTQNISLTPGSYVKVGVKVDLLPELECVFLGTSLKGAG
ncbi:hypothetical protein LOZ65_006689 [Ophidiomyces ophidiicola]|nr:hypothetical protein LOZ65_006689 [Ophidiomyces ophidiicola]